jgi:hypothetical protein
MTNTPSIPRNVLFTSHPSRESWIATEAEAETETETELETGIETRAGSSRHRSAQSRLHHVTR